LESLFAVSFAEIHSRRHLLAALKLAEISREDLLLREYSSLAMGEMPSRKILVGWTTVDSRRKANALAKGLVAARLAACVAVDGPITSHYIWNKKQERAKEWRLWVKFPADRAGEIAAWLKANHPYSVPQWLAVEAATVAEPYRQWVIANTRR
jgi:periplasmic divalent cation tolerance protein